MANNPTPEALPGYRQVKPMVFCGIYPADGAKYPDLKDALEKLQLNDASLTFELETSAALGFGFRCGFLGLLHMEIITERLEREFDLDLITTTPSVRYRLTLTDGTVEMIDNPSSYPDPSNIVKQEEPFVDVHLYTPNEYVGSLMDLCQNKRGVLIDMKYMDDVRVDLHYALPLGEIVYDFFDAIKSRSRGYASYDYEFKEYRESAGSLALGGAFGMAAVCTAQELLFIVIGGVFVMEAVSVVLQVGSYKLRHGKRIFAMAPIHHHFELKGWKETQVIARFWMISLLLAFLGLFLITTA